MHVFLASLLFAALALGQPAAAPLTFEVADVQVSKSGTPNGDFLPGGKLVVTHLSMKQLIVAAWDLDRWSNRVTGGPDWLDSEYYSIVAKAAPTSTEKELRVMLRNLLIERFKLTTHEEKRPTPVYALVVGKKTAKLQESAEGAKQECHIETPQDRKDGQIIRSYICTGTGMDLLAQMLPRVAPAYVDLPVVNLTELKGAYNFTLGWTPRGAGRGGAGRGGATEAGGGVAVPAATSTAFGSNSRSLMKTPGMSAQMA